MELTSEHKAQLLRAFSSALDRDAIQALEIRAETRKGVDPTDRFITYEPTGRKFVTVTFDYDESQ